MRIDAKVVQVDQAVRRGIPGLATRRWSKFRGGKERAARPLAIFALQGQQPRTPAFGRHARPFRRDHLGRRIHQVAQHLPADGGIGVEQPVQDGHGSESSNRAAVS